MFLRGCRERESIDPSVLLTGFTQRKRKNPLTSALGWIKTPTEVRLLLSKEDWAMGVPSPLRTFQRDDSQIHEKDSLGLQY